MIPYEREGGFGDRGREPPFVVVAARRFGVFPKPDDVEIAVGGVLHYVKGVTPLRGRPKLSCVLHLTIGSVKERHETTEPSVKFRCKTIT